MKKTIRNAAVLLAVLALGTSAVYAANDTAKTRDETTPSYVSTDDTTEGTKECRLGHKGRKITFDASSDEIEGTANKGHHGKKSTQNDGAETATPTEDATQTDESTAEPDAATDDAKPENTDTATNHHGRHH